MKDIFLSQQLLYRAVDAEEDEKLFLAIQCDALDYQLSSAGLKVPQGRKDAQKYIQQVKEDSLLGVVICLRPESDDAVTGEAIGVLHLGRSGPGMVHHRHSDIGIDIVKQHQGKGYGGEAILWATQWGFEAAGLNRIQLRAFEYNDRALHLYQKLGFKQEGRWREFIWHKGRFWDDFQFSMLASEWSARE